MLPTPPSSPLRLQILSTFYPHLGQHMGIRQVRRYFDPTLVAWTEQLVIKDRDHLPLWFRAMRRATRNFFSIPPRMYMLEDWLAERRLRRKALYEPPDVIQYLDGDHSYRHLTRWTRDWPRRPRCVAMFHMPPDVQDGLVDRDEVRRLDAVVAVSPDQADWFRSWMDPARVHLVLHGIDTEFFHPAPAGIPPEPPWRVITVGTNFRDYGTVFEVARRLADVPDLQFHVVRKFPPGAVIPSNVRVHTGLSDEELAALYRKCHVCLLPMTRATANNTLLEAMASGLPSVVTDLIATRAYTRPEAARLVPAGDADAAAAAVLRLVQDAALRAAAGRAAREQALGLDWKHTANALTRLYASFCRV